MKNVRLALISAALVVVTSACTDPTLCGDRVVWAPGSAKLGLAKNDQLFVCGDPAHAAWQDVPPRQSAAFMHSYLESKGYLEPDIKIDYDTNKVTVDAGKRAVITAILTEGGPSGWDSGPLETNLDQPLQKTTLDTIEADALGILKGMGYACATLKLEAHTDGRVVLKLNPGSVKTFMDPVNSGPFPVSEGVLRRYEPFASGEQFDVRETVIAAHRMEAESVSSATYTTTCDQDNFQKLERNLSFNAPRSWEIGIGASTEEYPLSFIRWKTNRLWSSASTFQAELFASNKRQELTFELKYYYSKTQPRLYLRPVLSITHQNENQYETSGPKVSLYQGRMIDTGRWTLSPEVGFSVSRLRYSNSVYSRTGPIFTPEVNLNAHTHDFELYQGDPRRGYNGTLQYSYLPGSEASSIGVHRFLLQGSYLVNYRNYVQPRWILGARYTLGSMFTTDGTAPDLAKTPPDWFFLSGGDTNLRGFSRNSLPSEQAGSGSVATLGLESRWPGLFSFPLDPLIFTDVGYLGSGNGQFNRDLIISPGFGGRSATPLGTVRATVARGYIPTQNVYRTQFFISFGTEF